MISEDDCDDYRRPSVLPVANFDDFDPSKPPASGEEYLRRVQLEAQKCPEIAVADVDVNSFRGQQTETLSNANGFNSARFEDRMSVDKQHEIVAYFTSLRMRVNGMRNRIPGNESVQEKTPSINDHQAWRRYIMDAGVESNGEKSNGEESNGEESNGEESNGESGRGKDPHLTLLLRFDQAGHHKLLKYLHTWTTEDGFCETIGLWIFSLLACLEKPIHSHVYATLRDISRTLSSERKRTDLESKDIKSINIIVCIIGRYFDQKDMIDE